MKFMSNEYEIVDELNQFYRIDGKFERANFYKKLKKQARAGNTMRLAGCNRRFQRFFLNIC